MTPVRDVLFGEQVAATDNTVWVSGGGQLYVFDPRSNEAERAVRKVPEVSDRIAVGEGAVWLAGWQGDMGPGGGTAPRGKVVRVDLEKLERHQGDAAFEEVGRIVWRSGQNEAPDAIATGFDSAWVVEELGDHVLQFSAEGQLLTEIPAGNTPVDVTTGAEAVWVIHTRSDPNHYGKGDASLIR